RRMTDEPDFCEIALVTVGEELDQARAAAQRQWQHALRERIERSGMANPPGAKYAPDACHDVVRRRSGRFANVQKSVQTGVAGGATHEALRSSWIGSRPEAP